MIRIPSETVTRPADRDSRLDTAREILDRALWYLPILTVLALLVVVGTRG